MAKQICLNPVLAALKGNFAASDEHGHKETLRFRETKWGTRYFGLGDAKARDYSQKPLTTKETNARAAFKAAAALRKTIMDSATLRTTWSKRYSDAVKAGSTACNTFAGYVMNQAIKGHIDDDGSYLE